MRAETFANLCEIIREANRDGDMTTSEYFHLVSLMTELGEDVTACELGELEETTRSMAFDEGYEAGYEEGKDDK